ncbi:MAG TPA: YbhB/YbcL family Raf kinase inhibitor-like protein [Spirochaetota bacterium]|nr:YbhB/YbcL family Raf kinase inhibitor-like protein [Spirochaetota bacterium]
MKRLSCAFVLIALIATGLIAASTFNLASPAMTAKHETGFFSKITADGRIDSGYAAGDKDDMNTKSFPLEWKDLPEGTKALAIVFDDPDAKPVMKIFKIPGDAFVHWIAADIDPAAGSIPANASASKLFPQGKNTGGTVGYVGPKPPSNIPADAKKPIIHVYRLTVYALSAKTGLKDGFTLPELEAAMKGKILGTAKLNFSYNN